jgi:hypothetical protein
VNQLRSQDRQDRLVPYVVSKDSDPPPRSGHGRGTRRQGRSCQRRACETDLHDAAGYRRGGPSPCPARRHPKESTDGFSNADLPPESGAWRHPPSPSRLLRGRRPLDSRVCPAVPIMVFWRWGLQSCRFFSDPFEQPSRCGRGRWRRSPRQGGGRLLAPHARPTVRTSRGQDPGTCGRR